MVKRKKAASKPAAPRRTTRRGKQAAAVSNTAEGETSTRVEKTAEVNNTASPKPDNSQNINSEDKNKTSESQSSETAEVTTTKPSQFPIIALHKKFGKYRCLFTSDENYIKKYEVGSDSETNSSIEVRVVDPCASSESDSNAALDIQSDTNSRNCFSPTNSTSNTLNSNSKELETALRMLHEPSQNVEIPLLNELNINISRDVQSPSILDDYSHSHDDFEKPMSINSKEDAIVEEQPSISVTPAEANKENGGNTETQLENHMEYGDDEIITVVQIVEDDNMELYYDIKIDSPKEQQIDDNLIKETNKPPNTDLQNHFEKLNITSTSETKLQVNCNEIIDITTPPCVTPDLAFTKENINEGLIRPDPSLTPSSTLSDDSNSSRITDNNQNNSNDSSESSPTGVRRSNRIKTISSLKQKTKGYGLVKTPLKKALITQTKLKLEEMGSDSQEKSSDNNPNSAPNSPSFPVPSEMPVKVKSRWRRSSELEMCANSPASSPLASPNLPSRLPPVNEVNNLAEEEQITRPMSKEAYDKIIEDRMNQYQHLDENEYLCDRMISKETKKMICDCFMTKEELERGELACGEDCLNRLLMIEW